MGEECGVLDLHVLIVFVDAWFVIDLSCVLACNWFLVRICNCSVVYKLACFRNCRQSIV